MVSKDRYYELKEAGLCVKCSRPRGDSPSSVRCAECHTKSKTKKTKEPEAPSRTLDETGNATICPVCGTPVESYDVACRSCLTRKDFGIKDALKKLNPVCRGCRTTDIDSLCIASADISKARSLAGPACYRAICQSAGSLPGYVVLCDSCYWIVNMNYIKAAYQLFDQRGQLPSVGLDVEQPPPEEDNTIEVEYEIDD